MPHAHGHPQELIIERRADTSGGWVRYVARDASGVVATLRVRADCDHEDATAYLEAYYRRHVRHSPPTLLP